MRFVQCATCGNEAVPLNDSVSVDKIIFCASCFRSTFPDGKQLESRTVETTFDPTVCSSCSKDFGNILLPKLGSYPICENCDIEIKEKIFPAWLKIFFSFLFVLVVFAYVWNWRFFQARNEITDSTIALGSGDYQQAAALMKLASQNAPEVSDIEHLAAYYNGIALSQTGDYEAARSEFLACKEFMPTDYDVDGLLSHLDMGQSFDAGDYDRFLAAAQSLYARDTTKLMSAANVASAYACLYAKTESDSVRKLAQIYLDQAIAGKEDTVISEYINRIEHRLATREILQKGDFDKKYPNGWK